MSNYPKYPIVTSHLLKYERLSDVNFLSAQQVTFKSEVRAQASTTWLYQASLIGEPSKMFSLNVALKIQA